MLYPTTKKQPSTTPARRASGHARPAKVANSQPAFQGVGPTHGQSERDADAVAEQIMQRPIGGPIPESAPPPEMSNSGKSDIGDKFFRSHGRPLSSNLRGKLQGIFGDQTLSSAKLHFGPEADAATKVLGAHALTVGNHIAFSSRGPRISTTSGLETLAHELRHTEQPHNEIRRKTVTEYGNGIISGETLSLKEALSLDLWMLDAILQYLAEQEDHYGGLPDHVYVSRRHIVCAITSKDRTRFGLAVTYNCGELLGDIDTDALTSPTQSEMNAQELAESAFANPHQSVDTSRLSKSGKKIFHESVSEDLAGMENMSHPKKAALEEAELEHDTNWLWRGGRKLAKKAGEKMDSAATTANAALAEVNDALDARFALLTNEEITAMLELLWEQSKSARENFQELADWFKDAMPAIASYVRECKDNVDSAVADFESTISDAEIPAKIERDVSLILIGAGMGTALNAINATAKIAKAVKIAEAAKIQTLGVDLTVGAAANMVTTVGSQVFEPAVPTGKSGAEHAAMQQSEIIDIWVSMTYQHASVIDTGEALTDNLTLAGDLIRDWNSASDTTSAPDFWKNNASKKYGKIVALNTAIENALVGIGTVKDLPDPSALATQAPSMTKVQQDLWIVWLAEEAKPSDLEEIVIANRLSQLGVIGGKEEVEEYFKLREHYYVQEYGEVQGQGQVAKGPVMWPAFADNIPEDVTVTGKSNPRLHFDIHSDPPYLDSASNSPSLMSNLSAPVTDEFFESIQSRAEVEAARIREEGNSGLRALTEAAALMPH